MAGYGEYRARPIAISLFTWGVYESRAKVLEQKFGKIDWNTIHDAAIAKGGWPELGGESSWGFFKLVVPNPSKNVGGLAAMISIGGEFYGRTDIDTAAIWARTSETAAAAFHAPSSSNVWT